MSVGYAQHWRLRRLDRWISHSDPHLAAMLAIFTRLTAGEAIASIEQAGFRHSRAWRTLALMCEAVWLLVACVCRACRRIAAAIARPRPGRERSWLGLEAGHVRSRADESR
jgi:hypothetical protein